MKTKIVIRDRHCIGSDFLKGDGVDDIDKLASELETFRTERTIATNDTDKFCKAICAFANDLPGSHLPGYLFIGVDKTGQPAQLVVTERLLESLALLRDNGNILPLPSINVFQHEFQGHPIVVVKVEPSNMPPVRYKQRVYIRTGPSTDIATREEERRLEERRVDRARTWDLQACAGSTLDDLALDIFRLAYLPASVSQDVIDENGRTIEEQLSSIRLFHPLGVPTNGAVLLFGKDPLSFVPGAYIQYVHYNGTDQASDVIREFRISGDLLTVFRELDSLAKSLACVRPVRNGAMVERDVADYPELTLHELFVNAVIHRNYEGSTTPVSVNHFADRIEIQNPGSLYGDLARSQFPNGTSYRNPILAEAAKLLGFANRFGRGIIVAQKQLEKNGSPPLEFFVGENHVVMIVRKYA